ncbi:Calx-beta domain-containing protein [Candidatus Magnetaquiglobus chichijimensis]
MDIVRSSDNTVVETIATNSALVTGGGTSTITINPANDLVSGTSYYLRFSEGAFKDQDGEIFGILLGFERTALTSATFLNFTVISSDPTVSLSVNSASIAEAAGIATVTATLSVAAASDTTVTIAATGTATGSGTDYTLASTTITILAGNTTGTATLTAVQDTLDEVDETVILDITNVSGGGGATENGTQQQTVTITDDDNPPTVSINSPSVTEGNSGTTNLTYTVTLSAASSKTITVAYATANGTATAGSDYTAASGTLTFAAGETSKTFNVTVAGDTTAEGDETLTATLTNPTNATLDTATGTGTITDDELYISSATYDANTGALVVTGSSFTANASGADVDVSKLVITGQNGESWSFDWTSDVEITSSTSFSVTLLNNDKLAADRLLCKNGTTATSGDTFTIATNDDWLTAVTSGDTSLTNKPLTVSNVANPLMRMLGTTLYADGTPVPLLPTNHRIFDPDGDAAWNGGSVTVRLSANSEATDRIYLPTSNPGGTSFWVDSNGNKLMSGATQVGTASASQVTGSSTLTFTFNASMTNDLAAQLLAELYYENSSTTPSTAQRTITVTATDGGGASNTGTGSLYVAPSDTLGGVAATGNLKVVVVGGSPLVYRYDGSSWVNQKYEYPPFQSTGSLLYTGSGAYGLWPALTSDPTLGAAWYAPGTIAPLTGQTATATDVTTTWSAGNLTVSQKITLATTTDPYIRYDWTVTNNGGSTINDLRLFQYADTYLSGGDAGAGFWSSGTNTVGVTKTASGETQRIALIGITTPSHYESRIYSSVINNLLATDPRLTDAIDSNAATDNGYAMEWDKTSLTAGSSWTVSAFESFTAGAVVATGGNTANINGSNVSVTYIVTNYGSTQNLSYSVSAPTGWNVTLDKTSDSNVAQNGSVTVTATITGTGSSGAGEYDLVLTATGSDGSSSRAVDLITLTTPPPPTVTLSVNNASIAEAAGTATVTATLSVAAASDTTVTIGATGTATGSGTDYTLSSTTITILAGNTTGTATLTSVQDSTYEGSETIILDITGVSGGGGATENGTQQQTVTITDDDPAPTIHAGTLLIIGFNADSTDPDYFSLVALEEISVGTVLHITDTGIQNTGEFFTVDSNNNTLTGDSQITWTVTSTVPAGKVLTQTLKGVSGALTGLDDYGTITSPDANGNNWQSAGDQLFIYSGTQGAASSATWLLAFTNEQNNSLSGVGGWQGGSTSLTVSSSSYKPSGVVDGTSGFSLGNNVANTSATNTVGAFGTGNYGFDNMRYNGITSGTVSQLRSAIFNAANWVGDNTNTYSLGVGSGYTWSNDFNITSGPSVSLSVNNASIAEAAGTATVTATLSAAAASDTTVTIAATGTATGSGTDYTLSTTTITILAGNTTGTATLTAVQDTLDEVDETVILDITNVSGGGGASESGTQQQTVTLTDDDNPPTVSIDSPTVSEGNSGSATLTYTVTLSAASSKTITVDYATANGTATAGSDYTAASGTLTFAAGETSKTFTVTVAGDTTDESDETLTATLSNPSNATLGTTSGTGTLTDDDNPPTVSINSPSVTEGNSGTTNLTYTVTLSAASSKTITVDYATANGTATAGSDYTAASGTLTFAAGETSKTFTVTVAGDTTDESDETLTATLSNPSNATLGTASGTGTLTDDDNPPTVSIDSPTVSEGNSGTTTLTYTVTLSAASGKTITVDYATANGTATAGTDYTAATGTLTFAAGETSKTFTVTVAGDTTDEPDETLTATLSNPSNVTLGTASGTGTLTDDDNPPTVSIDSPTVSEGNSGTTTLTYTVTLSAASGKTITVDYATANGTATAGTDYTAATGTLTFAAGETSKTFTVTVAGDTTTEGNETLTATLSNASNATLGTATGTGTLTDDDNPAPTLTATGATPTFTEGGSAVDLFGTVSASTNESGKNFTGMTLTVTNVADSIEYLTIDGTDVALTNGNSVGVSGGAAAVGVTAGTATVTLTGLSLSDAAMTTLVDGITYRNSSNAPTTASTRVVTITGITDNSSANASATPNRAATVTLVAVNPTVTLSVNNATIAEAAGIATVTATLSAATTTDTTVTLTASGTGTGGGTDYTLSSTTLTILANQTTGTATITAVQDTLDEADETVILDISNVTGGGGAIESGAQQSTITLTDDDNPPTVSIDSPTVTEGNSGSATLTYTVTLSAASGKTITVDYATANGTATAGTDYTAATGTLTFAAGETSKTFTVTVAGDTTDEPDETLTATLSNPSNATLGTTSGTGTLTDDDNPPTVSINSPSVTEGNSGTTNLTYTVTLSAASSKTITVDYATANGTASAGTDYTAATGTLTFAAGETSKTFTVTVAGDTTDEPDETLTATLSTPSNATLGTASGTGTLTDDDNPPTVSIDSPTVSEGNSGTATLTYTVTLSAASSKTITVDYATANGTASAGTDYTAATGTLTFAAGETSKTFTVTVAGDTTDESDETLTATLSNPSNVTLGTASGTGTLTDDDNPPTVSIDSPTVSEGNSGTTTLTYTVTLSAASGKTITVDYATANGTATAGTDYTAATGTLTFAAGETSKTFTVTVAGDTTTEGNETLTATLSNASNATLGTATGTGTLTDDDNAAPTLTTISNLTGATEDTAFTITYADLAAAANEADAESDPISFRIETVSSGILTKGGVSVVAGTTMLATGESLVWTPASNANGTLGAFTVKAHDTHTFSASAVAVNVVVGAVNDQPVVTAGGTLAYTENDAAKVIDATITLADVDDTQITGATVSIGSGLTSGDTLALTTQNGISGNYNATTGVLTLTGTATLAQYQAALRTVTFVSSSEDPTATHATRTVTWAVTDANSDNTSAQTSSGVTSTIHLTATADAPVVTAGGTLAYTENDAAKVIDATITLADVDDTQITGATVSIGSGLTSGDTLALTTQNGISGSYNATTGVLTLTGTATLAQYQAALRTVTFVSSSEDPTATHATRTVTWAVTDANSDNTSVQTSSGVTSTIHLTATADAPVVTAGGTLAYTENDAAKVIDATITLADVDDTQITGATVSIGSGLSSGDTLALTTQNGISGSYNATTGVLTLTGTATLAQYQAALRTVTFVSSSEDPTATHATRTVTWAVTDANSDNASVQTSSGVTSTIHLTATADAPVVTAGGTLAYTENDAAKVIDATITLADVDDTQITGATVSIGSGLTSGDTLALTTQNGISGSYNATTGVLTLTGTATLAQYQAALRTVTFVSSSEDPTATHATRTVTWAVTDANSDNTSVQTSSGVTSTIHLTATADAPVVTAGGTLAYTENDAAKVIDATITLADVDDTQITGATVSIGSGLTSGDTLALTTQNGISGSYNATTGVLTLTGTATLAQYQAALRTVTFVSSSEDPTATHATRTVTWAVTDANSDNTSAQTSSGVTSTIHLTATADAPVVTAGGTLAYTENDAAKVIDATITLADVDDTQITGATVSIGSGLTSGDTLALTTQNGISGNYNATTGVLTLTGTATLAQYQAALRTVTFVSSSEDPTATHATRTVTWAVTDANSDNTSVQTSSGVTSTIHLTATADAPVVTAGGTLAYTENDAAKVIDATITLADVDDTQITGATVSIGSGLTSGDTLALTTQNGISGSYNATTGVLTLTGTATLAQYQAALRTVTFVSSSEDPTATHATRTVTWAVTDANSDNTSVQTSSGVTSTIDVTAVDDAPVVTAGGTLAYTENDAAKVIDATLTLFDPDDTQLTGAVVTIATGLTSGDLLAFTEAHGISGGYDVATGRLTLTGTATLAQYQAVLRGVTFASASDTPTVIDATRGITWNVTDRAVTGANGPLSNGAASSAIQIAAVNDNPLAFEDVGTAVEAGGVANGTPGSDATGNLLTNDTDADGVTDTKQVSGIRVEAGQTGTVGSGLAGLYGTLTVQADGSFVYRVDHDNPLVQSLRLNTQTVTDPFVYTLRDGAGVTSSATLTITLFGRNDAPTVQNMIANQTWNGVGEKRFAFDGADFGDVDGGDLLTYTALSGDGKELPSWLIFQADTRTFKGAPPYGGYSQAITVTAMDRAGASVSQSFTIAVNNPAPIPTPPPPPPVESPPPVTNAASSSTVEQVVTYQATGELPSLNTNGLAPVVTFSSSSPPPTTLPQTPKTGGETVVKSTTTSSTATTPTVTPPPPPPITGTVTQAGTPGAFQIVVLAPTGGSSGDAALVVNKGIPDVVTTTGGGKIDVTIPPTAFAHTDANATVTLSAQQVNGAGLPGWLRFDPKTGKFSGSPPADAKGEVVIRVMARDNNGREAVTVFRIKMGKGGAQRGAWLDLEGDEEVSRVAFAETREGWIRPVKPQVRAFDPRDGFGKSALTRQLADAGRDGQLKAAERLLRAAERLSSRHLG